MASGFWANAKPKPSGSSLLSIFHTSLFFSETKVSALAYPPRRKICRSRIHFAFCIPLCICLDDSQGNLPSADASIHCLLLDVVVGVLLGHFQLLNEDPFGPVHQADLLHLLLDGGGLLFQLPQPFSGRSHPQQALLQQLGRNGRCQGENALGRHLGVDLVVQLRTHQLQYHRPRLSSGVDGQPGTEIIRQRRVDDDKVVALVKRLSDDSPVENAKVYLYQNSDYAEENISESLVNNFGTGYTDKNGYVEFDVSKKNRINLLDAAKNRELCLFVQKDNDKVTYPLDSHSPWQFGVSSSNFYNAYTKNKNVKSMCKEKRIKQCAKIIQKVYKAG